MTTIKLFGARSSFMEPLTPLPATVVITLGLWLVGSLCSVWSSPIGRYPISPEL